jgi:surface polysaccharide O-acyltransferase-like enzyme
MRKHYLDYLRVIAILAVVTIHVSGHYFYMIDQIGTLGWWFSILLNSASRFSVPLFVMISGAVLLGKNIDTVEFYKNRLGRLLPAIIFWNIFYVFFDSCIGIDTIALIRGLIKLGFAHYHLWYLTMFICLMLFAPFINLFIIGGKPTSNDIFILIFLLFILLMLNQISLLILDISNRQIEWFRLFPWYVIYFICGYYFDKDDSIIQLRSRTMVLAIVILILVGVLLNYIAIIKFWIVKDYLILRPDGPFVFIITSFIFLLVRSHSIHFKANQLITVISESTFGIYLIHPAFIYILENSLPSYDLFPIMYMPTTIFLTMIISLASVFLIRKINMLKSIC